MEPMVDEYHLLVGLEEAKVVKPKAEPKRTLKKRASKKVVQTVAEGDEKSSFSSEFDDVVGINCVIPLRSQKRGREFQKFCELQAFSPR